MKVHLLDGTYELFRHHFGVPKGDRDPEDEVAATRGVMWSVLQLLEEGVTHLGVATDHVIESFRNDLWPGYKSSAGVPEELLAQFPLLEEALETLGVTVFPMVELEADDALASAAATAAADERVEQVIIMTPDKDLAQMVLGTKVVQFDRRAKAFTDEEGVKAKYGVLPESIPDWLALVGDSADGFPGLPGWGKTSASAVLAKYFHIEEIPEHHFRWDVTVRGAARLASALNEQRDLALLFRDLATLRSEANVVTNVDELRWAGPTDGLEEMVTRLRAWRFMDRIAALDPR